MRINAITIGVPRAAAIFLLACATLLATGVSSALACETPIVKELESPQTFATRAHMQAEAIVGNVPNGQLQPEVTWSAEYATSTALLDEGKGMPAGGETLSASVIRVGLIEAGSEVWGVYTDIHHLAPSTTYFGRFHARNDECALEATKTFEFTTTSISRPEVFPDMQADINREEEDGSFWPGPTTPFSAEGFHTVIETNGAESHYRFEYAPAETGGARPPEASPSWQLFNAGQASGAIGVAEDYAEREASITGLRPESTYFVRLRAANGSGEVLKTEFLESGRHSHESFTTPSAKPLLGVIHLRNVTATSAHIETDVRPHGYETHWRFELAPAASGPWSPVPGAAGTISQSEAEALAEHEGLDATPGTYNAFVAADLSGLEPDHRYFVRLFAENVCPEFCGAATGSPNEFETSGPPHATAFATHAIHGEALRLLGSVNPNSLPTSAEQLLTIEGAPTGGTFTLTFNGQATAPLSYDADPQAVQQALNRVSGEQGTGDSFEVTGPPGGPYTVYFGSALGEKQEPALQADASGLEPSGSISVTVIQPGGEAYDTHYHFEYISQEAYEADGGSFGPGTQSTPPVDLGSGNVTDFVGADLPHLEPETTYRYRVAASNTSPGETLIHGAEQALTVPAAPAATPEGPCPNAALRTGPSAALPDCRAYEQLTPPDKEGSQEIFRWDGLEAGPDYSVLGEDGNRALINAPVTWGTTPTSGQPPYVFSRQAGEGWSTTAATIQPEAGLDRYEPELLAPDLSRVAVAATSEAVQHVGFKVGSPGGPYTTVAEIRRTQVGEHGGWVGASADFSKLILQAEDRSVVEPKSKTKSGADLYEYSEGALRQLNVSTSGAPLGTCGANLANGNEEAGGGHNRSSPHTLSADGSRVFFYADAPGRCSAEAERLAGFGPNTNLYVRLHGGGADAETVDIGAYRFLAASADGSRLLLEKRGAGAGIYLYTEAAAPRLLASTAPLVEQGESLTVSSDLSAIYLYTPQRLTDEAPPPTPGLGQNVQGIIENLYRYDVAAESLAFITQLGVPYPNDSGVSPDGRYLYFLSGGVGGLPGGGKYLGGAVGGPVTRQLYRYDNASRTIACVSCASPFDPEPRLSADLGVRDNAPLAGPSNGVPNLTRASGDGNYLFFQTPAALLPSDVDGEVPPEGDTGHNLLYPSGENSPSGDVYEWRAPGLDGCLHPQGCLALITDGRGGGLTILLGTAGQGRDVFFYSSSRLLPTDKDSAGDIYDARIGGGFPEPESAVQCEGDACFHPPAAPDEPTLSTSVPSGPGNERPIKHHKKRHHGHHRKKHHHPARKNVNRQPQGRAK